MRVQFHPDERAKRYRRAIHNYQRQAYPLLKKLVWLESISRPMFAVNSDGTFTRIRTAAETAFEDSVKSLLEAIRHQCFVEELLE